MTTSRTPSPVPGSTWSHPNLTPGGSGASTPSQPSLSPNLAPGPWESARMRNISANSYPNGSSSSNSGFLFRHMRRISSTLPRFVTPHGTGYYEKDKYVGRRQSDFGWAWVNKLRRFWFGIGRKWRLRIVIALIFYLCFSFLFPPIQHRYRRSSWGGGGEKIVIILGANEEGGVMDWKDARDWAIERDSVRNKRRYAARWGYDLEIVDMRAQKRYAHRWREGWQKADLIRDTLKKYPKAEWVWWLDLNTVIMEPSFSLQDHIFNELGDKVYRDINVWNPLSISHPFNDHWLDDEARSANGDGDPGSINLLLSQDCTGFSLGSFFLRRSAWSERLLDIWWDPVAYEQKHLQWKRNDENALEALYTDQPWVRQHTAFFPQRRMNSYILPTCDDGSEVNNTRFHYNENDRDFLVNVKGCELGRKVNRDCWAEMYKHREVSYWLNRSWWERFKEDLVAVIWFKMTGQRVKL